MRLTLQGKASTVWERPKALLPKLCSKGCSGRVNSLGYGNNEGDLRRSEWVTAERTPKLFGAWVKRIDQTGGGPMLIGWAQDRVSPLVKARLFVVRRDWYESQLWKLNKGSSGAIPYTKASCQGKTPVFPENQGEVRVYQWGSCSEACPDHESGFDELHERHTRPLFKFDDNCCCSLKLCGLCSVLLDLRQVALRNHLRC
jgi:hypothetical protein